MAFAMVQWRHNIRGNGVRENCPLLAMIEYSDTSMDAIERDKILNARAMSLESKLRAGLELFDLNRELILAALKAQHPEADAAALNNLFHERLTTARGLEACP